MIKYGAYLPSALVEKVQPFLDLAFLEPTEDPRYTDYYKSLKGTIKVLDNGLCENGGVAKTIPYLLDYAKETEPDIIIAPDRLGDWVYNYFQAKILRRLCNTGICLAGPAWDQQVQMAETENIQWIFLPYRLNRQPVAPTKPDTKIHLLGFKNPEDYLPYIALAPTGVISLDTVEPISAAFHEWSYADKKFASFPRPEGYAYLDKTKVSLDLILENINWFKNYLQRTR